jgi:hypothetical protein
MTAHQSSVSSPRPVSGGFEKIADQIAAFETELGALRPQPAEIKGLVDDTMSQLILDTSLASSLRRCFAANAGKPIDPCEADFSTWSRNLVFAQAAARRLGPVPLTCVPWPGCS